MGLGENLKKIMEIKNITEQQLSDITGISSSHINQVKNGGKTLSLENLQKAAKALGVTSSDLLGETIPQVFPPHIHKMLDKFMEIKKEEEEAINSLLDIWPQLDKNSRRAILKLDQLSPESKKIMFKIEGLKQDSRKIMIKLIDKLASIDILTEENGSNDTQNT